MDLNSKVGVLDHLQQGTSVRPNAIWLGNMRPDFRPQFCGAKILWIHIPRSEKKQAGAELCQAQVKLEVIVEVGVNVEV